MKIVVLYQYYKGHAAPGHSLIYELVQFLSERNHEVTVISGETGYMQRDIPILPWFKRIFRSEYNGKIKIIRTYTYTDLHKSYLGRFFSFISFSLSCPLGLLAVGKQDVLLASSPPIFPVFVAWLICKLRGIPFVFEVRDLWPESAVQMGILKNRQLIGIMSWMERVLYERSDKIIALTDGIKQNICNRGWPSNKIHTITCGVDFNKLYPDKVGGDLIRKKHGWENKKILMYFGALGDANNLDVIIRAAERLKLNKDINFVLIGDGMLRQNIENRILNLGIKNIIILPPVPKEDARIYINSASLCLVTLKDIDIFDGAIPTKLIDYMACGKAVLGGIRGEAARIVNEAGAGLIFEPNHDAQLSDLIVDLLSDDNKIQLMGANGFSYVKRKFDGETARKEIELVLMDLIDDKEFYKNRKR